jgi:hypothetical protein
MKEKKSCSLFERRSPLLVLGWLRSIQGAVYEGDIQEDDVEPPVPAGLRTLRQPLESFANFLGIDFDLIAAAAEQSPDESQLGISSSEILTWVRSVACSLCESDLLAVGAPAVPLPDRKIVTDATPDGCYSAIRDSLASGASISLNSKFT